MRTLHAVLLVVVASIPWIGARAQTGGRTATVVRSQAELIAALDSTGAGGVIRIEAGTYDVDRSLHVPDGVTLEGAGAMLHDADGLPAGFRPGTESIVRAVAGFSGPVLGLGNGSRIRGLRIVDVSNALPAGQARMGNVVEVTSTRPRDVVATVIEDCVIETGAPQRLPFGPDGPIGHVLLVATLNPGSGKPPDAHDESQVAVTLRDSVLRGVTGVAIFAANFASRSTVGVEFAGNRVEGITLATGGVSRPDLVTGSTTTFASTKNLYVATQPEDFGWLLLGASSPTHMPSPPGSGASSNRLVVRSDHDRIVGFGTAILAAAGRRVGASSAPLSHNRLELDLRNTSVSSVGDHAADFHFSGGQSIVVLEGPPGGWGPGDFTPGEDNVMRVRMTGVSGSGERANTYADVDAAGGESGRESGNDLLFEGTALQFRESNTNVAPAPDAAFFPVSD